jgi:hypothetical protein
VLDYHRIVVRRMPQLRVPGATASAAPEHQVVASFCTTVVLYHGQQYMLPRKVLKQPPFVKDGADMNSRPGPRGLTTVLIKCCVPTQAESALHPNFRGVSHSLSPSLSLCLCAASGTHRRGRYQTMELCPPGPKP